MYYNDDVKRATEAAASRLGSIPAQCVGLVSGTGLGGIAAALADRREIATADLPGFPRSTAPSHAGLLALGRIESKPVLLLSGRLHLYEGHSPSDVASGVRLLAGLGVKTLVLTNAAGALDPHFAAGGLMRITDHINLTGKNPLTGPNDDGAGPRFPDMSQAYSRRLGELADAKALELGIRLERGVYAGVAGPSLETPAETRMLRLLGADAVGMSTVTEVIAARHLGLSVLAISCLTNLNLPDCMAETTLEAVIATAKQAEGNLTRLLTSVIPAC
ncbi:purine-nucleoside phosphorylase [Desulfovibrio sp. TomC]|uniref:purine-nucleoside phosphorylase n=1 Tax=Desulfovibrio sp. TomC TaxID=1562888 RepID=UPI000574A21C|nr:purine-nucleoside phosphorylase [Desulfovibrio sp. TomC]KHK03255.1 Purine nucleoside phosphorylase [Desulfovibrio sp. TomC]